MSIDQEFQSRMAWQWNLNSSAMRLCLNATNLRLSDPRVLRCEVESNLLMNVFHSAGSKLLPWATPELSTVELIVYRHTSLAVNDQKKYDANHFKRIGIKSTSPKCMYEELVIYTVEYFERSIITKQDHLLLFLALKISLVSYGSAVSHDLLRVKPCWAFSKITLFSRKSVTHWN